MRSFKIVNGGDFDNDGVVKHLCEEPAQYPGCSGTRCLRDNVSGKQIVFLIYHTISDG